MLRHLSIRDFAIVDALELDLAPGFTALTGETGAGKSILIDALALALGDRADVEVIRAGAERAEIEAEFAIGDEPRLTAWLAENALEGDSDRLILRRLIDKGGRSRGFVNGRSATLVQMREAGEHLVDIHGQHAHQSLVRPEVQRAVLDAFGGHQALLVETGEAYRAWQRLRRAREDHEKNAALRTAERDQLAWKVDELTRLALKPGEWEEVRDAHSRLAHAASLIEGVETAINALSEDEASAVAVVGTVSARLRSLAAHDTALEPLIEQIEAAQSQIQEGVSSLRHYRDRIDLDPVRLKESDERLEAIHALARKLRARPEELVALAEQMRARLAEIDIESDLGALEREEAAAAERYRGNADRLTRARKKAAGRLAREVSTVMKQLALGLSQFEVSFEPIPSGSAAGDERVEFLVAINPGTGTRPLAKVASGGELSRTSLAIQVVTSRQAAVPTLIFDEVDAGIGGAVAEIVGRRLAALGEDRQVLCVTHLPQVAAQAHQQWTVAKITSGGTVRNKVSALDAKGRIEEIARMLGGQEITATTRKHAAELLGVRVR